MALAPDALAARKVRCVCVVELPARFDAERVRGVVLRGVTAAHIPRYDVPIPDAGRIPRSRPTTGSLVSLLRRLGR
jgi:hypothetical protein